MRTTSLTPGKARRLSVSNCSTSPTSPTMVRWTPRLTNAVPPASCTVRTTASSSSAVAPGDITTTMCRSFSCGGRQSRGWLARARHVRDWSHLEAFDGRVGTFARAELDEVHRGEHEQRPDHCPRPEHVTADRDTEDAGEHRLHRHDDGGPG